MQAALQVKFPCPNQGVKIVLPIPFRGNLLVARCRRAGILLREPLPGQQS
jgi:hypothetical protein